MGTVGYGWVRKGTGPLCKVLVRPVRNHVSVDFVIGILTNIRMMPPRWPSDFQEAYTCCRETTYLHLAFPRNAVEKKGSTYTGAPVQSPRKPQQFILSFSYLSIIILVSLYRDGAFRLSAFPGCRPRHVLFQVGIRMHAIILSFSFLFQLSF